MSIGMILSSLVMLVNGCLWPCMDNADTVRVRKLDSVRVVSAHVREDIVSPTPYQDMDEIKMLRTNVVDMTDGLNRMAGVTLRDYGGAGGMKTVSVRGLGANHTMVSLDGITMTDVQTGQVDLNRYNMMGIGQIRLVVADEADLLRSARSAISSAMLELETQMRDVATPSWCEVTLEQGSFGRYGARGLWQKRLTDKWTVLATGGWRYVENKYPYTLTNGRVKSREYRINNCVRNCNVSITSRWKINENSVLKAKMSGYDCRCRLPGQVIYYNPSNAERQNDRAWWTHLTWSQKLSPRWMIKVRGKWDWNECRYKDIDEIYPNGIRTENYWQREGYIDGVVRYDVCPWMSMSYAADYIYNNLNSNQAVNDNVSRHSLLQSLTTAVKWKRLTANGRLVWSRFVNHAERTESARDYNRCNASASVSLKVLEDEKLYVRAFFKDIFRLPTFTESYYYHLGNIDLSPEKTSQYGAGLTWQKCVSSWWPLLKVTVDGYYNRITDKITSVPMNLHEWRTVNIGKVEARGCDFVMENQWLMSSRNRLVMNGTCSFQDVVDITLKGSSTYRKQLAYMPHLTFSAALAYENPVLNAAVSVTGCSYRWATHEHVRSTLLPSYAELTASVWRSFRITDGVATDVRLSVQNIGDTQYDIIKGYPMPGRAYRITLTTKF